MLSKVSWDAGKSSEDITPGALCLVLKQVQPFSTGSAFLTYEGEETTLNTLYSSEKNGLELRYYFLKNQSLEISIEQMEQSPIWPN